MADNTLLNAGTGGDTVRDIDHTSVKTQVVAVSVEASGEAELLGLGDARVVVGTSANLTTGATAYTAGDNLGTEMTFPNITRAGRGAVINSAVLVDKSLKVSAVDLFLFDSSVAPTNTDNLANSWSDGDILKLLGVIHFADAMTSALNTIILPTNTPIVVKPSSGTTIYGYMVTRTANAASFGATTDIQVTLGVLRD